jgi:O-antigen/teichoic acid export membrane protein
MNDKKTVFKNISALFGAQVITSLLNPLLLIYIARQLGDEIFGKYSFIMAFITIFIIVSDFGIKAVAIRDVARDPSKIGKYLGNILLLKVLLSGLSISIFILIISVWNAPKDTTQASYIFAGGLFFQSMSYAFRWVFHATQSMEYEAMQRVIERVLLLVISVAVIWKGFGLIALSLVFLGTQIIIFALSLIFCLKLVGIPKIGIDKTFYSYLISTAIFFTLSEMLWTIYFQVDLVMLAKIIGEKEVGWYKAAYVVVNFITMISMLLMQAFFPVFSNLYEKGKNKLKETAERLFRYLIFLALPTVPIVFMLSDKIISLIYREGYSHSILALRILIPAIFFVLPAHLFGNILSSSNRHKTLTLLNMTGVILNIGLNLILIPRLSYKGAGIATLVTEAVMVVLLYKVVSKFLKLRGGKILSNALFPFFAMVLIIYIGRNFSLIPVLSVASLVYLGLTFLTGTITKEDLLEAWRIVKRNSPKRVIE